MNYINTKNYIYNKANRYKQTSIPNKFRLNEKYEELYGTINIEECNSIKNRIESDGSIKLDIISLNARGVCTNKIGINNAATLSDVLCLQELLHGQAKKLHKHLNTTNKNIVQRVGTRKGNKGRYSGGLAFLVSKNINISKSEFKNNNIGLLYINNLVIINVYLPYYNGDNTENMKQYEEDICWLINKISILKKDKREVIVCGDFNTDFARLNKYSVLLTKLLIDTEMTPFDIMVDQINEFTYEKRYKRFTIKTWIDHVLIGNNNLANVEYMQILKGDQNMSDHYMLKLKYRFKLKTDSKTIVGDTSTSIKQIKWYKDELRNRYKELVLVSSNDLNRIKLEHSLCTDEAEKILLATCYFNELSHICISANKKIVEEENTKKSKNRHKRKLFVDQDESYKVKMLHKRKCDSYLKYRDSKPEPWDPELGAIYLRDKNEFRAYLRFYEKNQANIKFRNLNNLFKSDKNGFWRCVKNMNQIKNMINIPLEDITRIYRTLFNTSNFPDSERDLKDENELNAKINEFLKNKKEDDYVEISPDLIEKVIGDLNNGKAVGFSGVSNEMLKYGICLNIVNTMSYMMEWIINSGNIPKLFNISLLKPLIKDSSKPSDDPNNLRTLSISDVYPGIYEKIMLIQVKRDHVDHQTQFGFRANSSCSHSSFVLNEIIKISKELKKSLFIISIDASKAFDRVNRTRLWLKMFELEIRPVLIISLRNYYNDFYFIVNNANEYSALIKTTYGVKQGGNISPDLYKLYSESLAIEIEKLKIGVKVGNLLVSVLMYADDVILIASTPTDAQALLNVVTKFGTDYQVKFNPNKTNIMIETARKDWQNYKLKLCNEDIVQSTQIKYLGNEIGSNGKSRPHLEIRKTKAISALQSLRTNGILNNEMETKHKIELFNIYVKPLLYYGVDTFNLNIGDSEFIEKAEGNLLKSLLSIPKKCHSTLIYSAMRIPTTNEMIEINKLKFLSRALKNEFVGSFIHELLQLDTKTNTIGKLKSSLLTNVAKTTTALTEAIDSELIYIKIKADDRFNYNNEVSEILDILSYTNSKYRSFKLTKYLYYNHNQLP